MVFDARHKKTDLKVFVVVIPKEGWARPFDSADIKDHILKKLVSCHKKDGRGHARPSFFWHDNDNDLFSVFSWHKSFGFVACAIRYISSRDISNINYNQNVVRYISNIVTNVSYQCN